MSRLSIRIQKLSYLTTFIWRNFYNLLSSGQFELSRSEVPRPWITFQNLLCLTPLIWQNFCACIIEDDKNGIRRIKNGIRRFIILFFNHLNLRMPFLNLRMPFFLFSIMHAQKFCQMRGVKHRKFWNLNQGLDMSVRR